MWNEFPLTYLCVCEAADRHRIGSPSMQGCHLVTLYTYYVHLQFIITNTIYVQTNKFTSNITLTSVGSTICQLITIILTTYSLYTNPPNPRVIAIRCDLVTSRLLGNPSPDQLIVHVELSRCTIISTALVSDFFSLKFFIF